MRQNAWQGLFRAASLVLSLLLVVTVLGQEAPRRVKPEIRKAQPPKQDRSEFFAKYNNLRPGMSEKEVVDILGPPDGTHSGYWLYGWNGPGTPPQLAILSLSESGELEGPASLYTSRTPTPNLPTPEVLADVFQKLHDVVRSTEVWFQGTDPLAVIRACNALVRIGPDQAEASLTEFMRTTSQSHGLWTVVNILFEPGKEGHIPPPSTPSYSWAKFDGPIPERYPHAIVNGVPFTLYVLNSSQFAPTLGGPLNYFRELRSSCNFRQRLLIPTSKPWEIGDLYDKGIIGPKLRVADKSWADAPEEWAYVQLLFLLRTVYVHEGFVPQPTEPFHFVISDYSSVAPLLEHLEVCWNAELELFTFTDGTVLEGWEDRVYDVGWYP